MRFLFYLVSANCLHTPYAFLILVVVYIVLFLQSENRCRDYPLRRKYHFDLVPLLNRLIIFLSSESSLIYIKTVRLFCISSPPVAQFLSINIYNLYLTMFILDTTYIEFTHPSDCKRF